MDKIAPDWIKFIHPHVPSRLVSRWLLPQCLVMCIYMFDNEPFLFPKHPSSGVLTYAFQRNKPDACPLNYLLLIQEQRLQTYIHDCRCRRPHPTLENGVGRCLRPTSCSHFKLILVGVCLDDPKAHVEPYSPIHNGWESRGRQTGLWFCV